MHRLLVSRTLLDEDAPHLEKEAARHLKVLRPEAGELVELFDGRGASRVYAWRDGLLAVSAVSEEPNPFAHHPLTLFACVTKGSRWDWTIEKATELGVARIVPVISERTIVRLPPSERSAKRDRWLRIAEDAVRQSHAHWLPDVCEAVDFPDALALAAKTDCFVGALVDPPAPPLAEAVRQSVSSLPPAVFVGPEGDFTPAELAALLDFGHPTNFGPTVLRAETDALYAVAVLRALLP